MRCRNFGRTRSNDAGDNLLLEVETFAPLRQIPAACGPAWFEKSGLSAFLHAHLATVSMKVLSGIQPTGAPHWGNYFGAIRQYIALQGNEQSFYFVADLHALTTIRDPDVLAQNSKDVALDLLALGLDPEQATLFRQSDVPEVTELTWLLLTITQMHLLEKCVSYKDKKERGIAADAGLFTYPVLMASDILIYDSDVVPVGADQDSASGSDSRYRSTIQFDVWRNVRSAEAAHTRFFGQSAGHGRR